MKTKKILVYLGVLILGAVVVSGIDRLIGIDFKDVGMVASFTHRITHMLLGGALLGMGIWFDS